MKAVVSGTCHICTPRVSTSVRNLCSVPGKQTGHSDAKRRMERSREDFAIDIEEWKAGRRKDREVMGDVARKVLTLLS